MRPEYLAFLCLALAGCGSLGGLRSEKPAVAPAPSTESVQAAQLASYITGLQQLVQGSPAEQAEIVAAAHAAYDQAHQGPAALRYGLVLAAPSHPARDPVQAQRVLRETLARPELLNIVERALAVVELQRVDAELRIATENERLVGEAQRERDRQRAAPSLTALNRRLQAEQEENARLKKALDEARAKLDAIVNIELERSAPTRSNPERPPSSEGRYP
ncbi:MAG: hypothetical protein IPH71_12245 [Proteobacteria bacterium]|nr:hypothetical protein [Pseudomonadota bacterium]MBK7116770.1 hypothetical protein [Pseudomonadota bacterium]